MRTVRYVGALLAVLIIANFTTTTVFQGEPAMALLPEFLGAVVMVLASLRDAASTVQRKAVVIGTVVLLSGVFTTLAINLQSRSRAQTTMAAILLVATTALVVKAVVDARRRRRSVMIRHYLSGYGAD